MPTVGIDRIKVQVTRRPLKPEKVAELKESIKANGLLNPITLDRELNLIAGLHRLTACKMLGFDRIECNIITCENNNQARLAEIDENLIRSELEALERAELWLEREQILEQMGLRAQPGENQHARKENKTISPPPKTTEELAKETGYTKRTYQYGKQIASKILPEVKQVIKGTQIATKTTALLKIARAGSEEHKKAEEAEKAAREAETKGDKEEAQRQSIIVAESRAKQKELQLLTLAELQKKKAKSAAKKVQSDEVQSSDKPVVRIGDEWLLDRHMVYCGDTSSSNFINLLPSEAALAIAIPSSNWHHDYLIDKARVVAVVMREGQIHEFCTCQQMPFRFELLLGELYVAVFSHQSISKPRKPIEIEGIEGIVTYLVNQYTNRNLGFFVFAPTLGNGEILITCERMGRICFSGDNNPQTVSRAIARWQNWTLKQAVKENQRKFKNSVQYINDESRQKVSAQKDFEQNKKSELLPQS
ncbi:ParB N-terminal domain-containing protein [Pleurocapsales cyanobacterium LEGE 06147]|nr:ParB N-terminal domain-containing protein [Pleurocapsales cyanobacterium LEGE 06147]